MIKAVHYPGIQCGQEHRLPELSPPLGRGIVLPRKDCREGMSLAAKAPQLQAFISLLSLVSIACELQDAAAADSHTGPDSSAHWSAKTLKSGSKSERS